MVYTGTDGYDFGLSDEYDVIILDRLLPGIDGLTICQRLRAEGVHTPILMLTAKGQVDDRVEGLNAGADDYLVKPFAFSELLARVKALIRRPQKTASSILTVADLQLNTITYEVNRGGKDIRLSSKEFSLLEYLLRHANKIITKDQIINHVWDYDASVLPNSVEVYIRHLRSKIDMPFRQPLIHTVRGFGYKISERP